MIDFSKIKTYPIKDRKNKFSINDSVSLDNTKNVIDNSDVKKIAENIVKAAEYRKQVIFMFGGHIIKLGLSGFIIDLMKKKIIKHIAVNGAVSIHDFEIAMIGETSEDVAHYIEDGSFGMVEETGRLMNDAIKKGAKQGLGYGESISKKISDSDFKFKDKSIFYWAYKLKIPITVHIAIGSDIIHQHPSCSGEALGKASYNDFKIFTDTVSRLKDGVVLNIGSSVILPETFLKALTISRNLGYDVKDFTAANFDMEKQYRPRVNVVERPVMKGGQGYYVVERHEKTIPTLYNEIMGVLNG